MNWFQQAVGKEWDITPAGGLTGNAYIAQKNGHRLFLKRNSSPFLAVLSAEGIVPKLVFTKRMKNGDVITAQEWLEGRELKSWEMQQYQVADLLCKIHDSTELLHMLMRLGKKPITSDERFESIQHQIQSQGLGIEYQDIRRALNYLKQLLPVTRNQPQAVCHCDLNHNNLILTTNNQLYLIDWDNAMIADPITDVAYILNWYVSEDDWNNWLDRYGLTKAQNLFERLYWYMIMDNLQYIVWYWKDRDFKKVDRLMDHLRYLNNHVCEVILD